MIGMDEMIQNEFPETNNADWQQVTSENLPPEGVMVATKIDDGKGARNHQKLCRRGRLWWTDPSGDAMYVYYTPTHWRHSAA